MFGSQMEWLQYKVMLSLLEPHTCFSSGSLHWLVGHDTETYHHQPNTYHPVPPSTYHLLRPPPKPLQTTVSLAGLMSETRLHFCLRDGCDYALGSATGQTKFKYAFRAFGTGKNKHPCRAGYCYITLSQLHQYKGRIVTEPASPSAGIVCVPDGKALFAVASKHPPRNRTEATNGDSDSDTRGANKVWWEAGFQGASLSTVMTNHGGHSCVGRPEQSWRGQSWCQQAQALQSHSWPKQT